AQTRAIESTLMSYLTSLRPEDRELEQVQLIAALARKGIGFHHAGLLPVLKQLVELLFSRGLMQVVFATDTLALGVNMPARSVVIGRMSKWDGRRRRVLIPNEFQQMAGRAGRRGMDAFGHVIVPYSPWLPFREMLDIATGPLEPVRSAFAVRYNTVLNLWDPPDGERVRQMLEQSLAQFQTSQRIRLLEDDVIEIGGDIAAVPKGCLIGLDGGDELLEDYRMLVATLQTSEQKLRRLEEDRERAKSAIEAAPWPEPGRQTLRRVLRTAPVGLVIHERELGWGVFLGKALSGIGSFLFGREVHVIAEYRQVDYVTDGKVVDLASAASELTDPEGKGKRLSLKESRKIQKQLDAMELPDLEAMREEHRQRERERVALEVARIDETLREAVSQSESLNTTRDHHPCHHCPVRKEHRNHLHRVDKLERERNTLQDILEREQDAEDARIRGVIRGIREVLDRFGYMHRGYPTAKADMLAAVFDNDALILCELVDRGILDRLLPEDLAEVFSWFSFDRDFRYANHLDLPDDLLSVRRRLEDIEHTILGEERDHKLFISEGHNPSFYGAARAWARGQTMIEITGKIQLSEGDLVLTFNKTIDLLRQVREMLEDVLPDHPLRNALRESERLLRRDIVEQSLTLGFAPIVDDAIEPDSSAELDVDGLDAEVLPEAESSKPVRGGRGKKRTS
ncbi:MAG: helicase-related protein, partial [Thermomicrobiales bacterium]